MLAETLLADLRARATRVCWCKCTGCTTRKTQLVVLDWSMGPSRQVPAGVCERSARLLRTSLPTCTSYLAPVSKSRAARRKATSKREHLVHSALALYVPVWLNISSMGVEDSRRYVRRACISQIALPQTNITSNKLTLDVRSTSEYLVCSPRKRTESLLSAWQSCLRQTSAGAASANGIVLRQELDGPNRNLIVTVLPVGRHRHTRHTHMRTTNHDRLTSG